jgi:hypothetical protein
MPTPVSSYGPYVCADMVGDTSGGVLVPGYYIVQYDISPEALENTDAAPIQPVLRRA